MYILVVIGRNIKFYRDKFEITQEELAFRADVSVSYLCKLENGKQNVTVDILDRIACGLGIFTYQLFMESMEDTGNISEMTNARMARYKDRIDFMPPGQQKKTIQLMDVVTSLTWNVREDEEVK